MTVSLPVNDANLLLNEALTALNHNKLRAARLICLSVLDLSPGVAEAWLLLGMIHRQAGKMDRAVQAYRRALEVNPNHAEAYNNLGNALWQLRQYPEAIDSYRKVLSLRPDWIEIYLRLSVVLLDNQQYSESAEVCRQGLMVKPDHADFYINLGTAERRQGHLDAAIESYRQAARLKPESITPHQLLCLALQDVGRTQELIAAHRECLKFHPDVVEFINNLGVLYQQLGHTDQAIACYEEALSKGLRNITAYSNLGNAYHTKRDFPAALRAYQAGFELDPRHAVLQSMASHVRQKLCDWENLTNWREEVLRPALDWNEPASEIPPPPFNFLAPPEPITLEEQLRIAEHYAAHLKHEIQPSRAFVRQDPAKLRIGYVSADYHNHATMHLMGGLFRRHDRNRFEIYAYSLGADDGSDYRKRAIEEVDHFFDIALLSNEDAARKIHADGIHILVDLKGYTGSARPGIFPHRPAPIQVSYLGYPGTLGGDFMDYVLADPIVTPPEHQPYYTEKLVLLPHAYQINDNTQPIADEPSSRMACDLPDHAFVFCCFNSPYKIDPTIFTAWMEILKQTKNSVLWLFSGDATVIGNLRRQAEQRGVDGQRLRFASSLPKPHHLARLRLADLFLDTRFYNAHTTASDALWAGLPLITVPGETFAARVAASLLTAVGLPELIVADLEAYVKLAVELAHSSEKRSQLRKKLQDNRLVYPLFDTDLFTKHLERAYTLMWDRWLQGEPATMLVIEAETCAQPTLGVRASLPLATHGSAAPDPERFLAKEEESFPIAPSRSASDSAVKSVEQGGCESLLPAPKTQDESESPQLPQTLDEWLYLALDAYQSGNNALALRLAQQVIEMSPSRPDAWTLLGAIYRRDNEIAKAIEAYRQAIAADPAYADSYHNLGNALNSIDRLHEAEAEYRHALELRSDWPEALNSLAYVLWKLQRCEESEIYCRQAIALRPDYAEAYQNLGNALLDQHRSREAIEHYRTATRLNPALADAWYNQGNVLKDLNDHGEAVKSYRKALELRPFFPWAFSNMLFVMHYDPGLSAETIAAAHREYDRQIASRFFPKDGHYPNSRDSSRRLKIGYVSADFMDHPVANYFEPVLEQHDPEAVEVYCYAQVGKADKTTARLQTQAEHWRFIVGLSDDELAAQIRQDQIDILVDMSGHTAGNRLLALARKPAPVQIGGWLGYFNTTGMKAMDYLLGDDMMIPPENEPLFTEQIYRFEGPCQCYRLIAKVPDIRPTPALESGVVSFGTYNNPSKISEKTVRIWARILKEVPNSRLVLENRKYQDAALREELLDQFSREGVGEERIVLRWPYTSFHGTDGSNGDIDIALDPFPYNGGSTTLDTLWVVGSPLISLLGNTPMARHGADYLHHLGLDELIAPTLDRYIEIAVELAGNMEKLNALRLGMRQRMLASPLFDTAGFTRRLEAAYRALWQKWCENSQEQPASESDLSTSTASRSVSSLQPQSSQASPKPARKKPLPDEPAPDVDDLLQTALQHYQQGRHIEAIRLTEQALEYAQRADAWTLLGACHRGRGELDQAIVAYRKAIQIDPNYPDAHSNLGNALRESGAIREAAEHYQAAIALQPKRSDLHNSLGGTYRDQGKLDSALACFEKALKLQPDNADFHWDYSLALLAAGQYQQGWVEHEWRWRRPPLVPRPYSQPLWKGQALKGKRLLVYAEQGLGDSIQFLRFVPQLKAQGARIILEIQKELQRMMELSLSVEALIALGESAPAFDYHVPLHSLPLHLNVRLEHLPGPMPYLQAAKKDKKAWKSRFQNRSALKVGLVWAGSPTHRHDHWRSSGLETLLPLFERPGVEFYLLQKGPGRKELEEISLPSNAIDLNEDIHDFADTAAIVSCLDVVITPDTSVAHLVGALNRPCWVLLAALPDWRWMFERSDCVWYPSLRLFRQSQLGQWDDVVERVGQELDVLRSQQVNGAVLSSAATVEPPLETSRISRPVARKKPARLPVSVAQSKAVAILQTAIEDYHRGELAVAESQCQEALALAPKMTEAWTLLGMIQKRKGDWSGAEVSYQRSIELNPHYPDAYKNLGNLLMNQRRFEEAKECFASALQLRPQWAETQVQLAEALRELRRPDEAASHCREVLQYAPDFPSALNTLANSLRAQNQLTEAIEIYRRAITVQPDYLEAYSNLGIVLVADQRHQEAIEVLLNAIEHHPRSASLHVALGNAYKALGHYDAAIAAFKTTLEIEPATTAAWVNLSTLYHDRWQTDQAMACCREALAINPDLAEAHLSLGAGYYRKDRLEDAIEAYEKTLRLDPSLGILVYNNLGSAYKTLGRTEEALFNFRKALELEPRSASIHSNLLLTLNYATGYDPEALFAEYLEFARRQETEAARTRRHANPPDPDRPLRIGYVSGDFNKHPVATFFEPIIRNHDKSRFRIYCYSTHARCDAVNRRFQTYADAWREIYSLSDAEAERWILEDQIDLLVDLSGHSAYNRLSLFAKKPAPVQASYLGFPGTSGLSTIDYRFSDAFLEPEGPSDRLSSETIYRLTTGVHCYHPGDTPAHVTTPPAVENGYVTFGCFNNFAKVTAEVIATWANILHAVPTAQLLLEAPGLGEPTFQEHVQALFTRQSIGPERLQMLGRIPENQYRLYNQVDIALDPFPYNGGTTSADTLWMSVPLITLAGNTYSSRMGVSWLSIIGLPELIADTRERYQQLAIELATDLPRLTALRGKIHDLMLQAPTTDEARFTQEIERAYRWMWRTWCANSTLT
jgi:predicted O-linked N-acetylglucosamine transferase (SPINDLY family)